MDYLERKKLFVLNLSVSLWQGDLAVRGERTPVSLGKLLAPYTVSRAIFQIWGAAYSGRQRRGCFHFESTAIFLGLPTYSRETF